MKYNDNSVVMEGVRIIFRNFAGKEGKYNREGDRNFGVLLDDDIAEAMAKDGWNVKWLKPRDEDEKEQAYLTVAVNFKGRPPRVVMVTSRGRTPLGEEDVEVLDWADISNVDMIVRPYEWAVNGKTGIKAYLKSIFVTINEDELELKYADVDQIPTRSGRVDE
ncbi:MAG TPA: hypothetical protein PK584_01860 [Fervidobacterium sp.]|jgi:hypothetical protein|nr:hypothetical protein [Fervidobacterium sp.]